MLWALLFVILLFVPGLARAQSTPPQRVVRTYIPPDQLVSFLPSTPFSQFVEFLNPIFTRVTGKEIIDPESRSNPIGIAISGMHFMDAFELVLQFNGLRYRETEKYFIVESPPDPQAGAVTAATAVSNAPAGQVQGASAEGLATLSTREIQINAVLFDVNHTKARELGIDWNALFGTTGGSSGGGSGGFTLHTGRYNTADGVITIPDEMSFTKLTQLFRVLETEGVGQTVANPQVTVQSGEKGHIQIGSDVPIQTRDFAGNTITQMISTGIIVDVTPTLISQSVDGDSTQVLDFIHLNVHVEKSGSRVSAAGPVIDRNNADTQVLLLPGEQTVIGGLYSTDETVDRRGIPILKDLPGWFFGLRYIFGHQSKTLVQKELLIVLQADLLEPLEARAEQPFDSNLLEKHQEQSRETIGRVSEQAAKGVKFPGKSLN